MSEEIKPKKERKFLKALGKIGEVLIQELFFRVGSNLIRKIGGKKTLPSILFLLASLSLFAQFPNTGNKQRLGFQTTADGLTWRGALSDTASIKPINNQNAWVILDTINLKFYTFDFTSNVWNLVGGGGAAFTQPVDSLFFNTGVPTNNVDTAKMRWDSDLATVVLGLNDNVPNELGFKNFWLVKNQTGATITKGSIVYANGTVGASGRITVAKFIANGSIDAKYLLGITAHDLTDGEDGYVISFGKIRQVNTDTFAAGAILYPSPTVAGVWTDVEPVAPNIDMPIGFCINSSVNNGTIAIRVASGYKLSELHDVSITSPVEKSSLYYSGGLWRDTTAALLVSDTASMLTPYFRDADTSSLNLTSRFAAKQNTLSNASASVSGILTSTDWNTFNNKQTAIAFAPPLQNQSNVVTISQASSTDNGYLSISDWNTFNNKLNLSDTASMLTNYLRTGTAASTYLPLTGGTLTGDLYTKYLNTFAKTTYVPFNTGIGEQSIFNVGTALRGGTVMVFPDSNLVGSSANIFLANSSVQGVESSAMGSGMRNYAKQGGDTRRNSLAFYTSGIGSQNTNRLFIDFDGNVGINDDTPSYKLDVNGTFNASGNSLIGGTLGVTGATTLNNGLNITGTTNILNGQPFSTLNIIPAPTIGSTDNTIQTINTTGLSFKIGTTERMKLNSSGLLTVTDAATFNSSAVFNEGSTDSDFRVESDGNAHMVFVDASTDRVGIGYASPTKTLDVNGEVRINTVTATPTSLLGKDGSNVVGEVTDINQSGVMKVGGTTATTDAVGNINVAHGLSYTPSKVIATIAQLNSYIIVVKGVTSSNLEFTIYDSTTGVGLDTVSVGFYWIAFK